MSTDRQILVRRMLKIALGALCVLGTAYAEENHAPPKLEVATMPWVALPIPVSEGMNRAPDSAAPPPFVLNRAVSDSAEPAK